MFQHIKSDYIGKVFIIATIVLLLEVTFFNRGLFFSLLVAMGMIYIGRKWMVNTIGKIFFWLGILFFVANVLSMMAFKFVVMALIIYFFIQFRRSKKRPNTITPVIQKSDVQQDEAIELKKPLFRNILFGKQQTDDHVYEWNDVNIQVGIGDTVIDLTYTVLPQGETVIFIRNFVGNVHVSIPYDIEVSVQHNVLAGSVHIFDYEDRQVFNSNIHLQTAGYDQASQKVKIFTSFFIGDIEVKRK